MCWKYRLNSIHTEFLQRSWSDAIAPFSSRLCIGFAPRANGSPAERPSGVAPVLCPYTTFAVIVKRSTYVGRFYRLRVGEGIL